MIGFNSAMISINSINLISAIKSIIADVPNLKVGFIKVLNLTKTMNLNMVMNFYQTNQYQQGDKCDLYDISRHGNKKIWK